jgi:hypothetical protein
LWAIFVWSCDIWESSYASFWQSFDRIKLIQWDWEFNFFMSSRYRLTDRSINCP